MPSQTHTMDSKDNKNQPSSQIGEECIPTDLETRSTSASEAMLQQTKWYQVPIIISSPEQEAKNKYCLEVYGIIRNDCLKPVYQAHEKKSSDANTIAIFQKKRLIDYIELLMEQLESCRMIGMMTLLQISMVLKSDDTDWNSTEGIIKISDNILDLLTKGNPNRPIDRKF